MKVNKLTFFFAGLLFIPLIFNAAYAQEIEKGKNFDRVLVSFNDTQTLSPEGYQIYSWTSTAERINDGAVWREYILTQDANSIKVETGQGSFMIDKNTCIFSFYNKGKITGAPTISDTYLARQSIDGIVWNEVSQINNASCQTNIIESGNNIEVQTIKSSAIGEMKIRYIKNVGVPLKTQMEVTNTSGLNDRYFSFYQLMEVPQSIKWGTNTINLATKNNNVYDRNFIVNNKSNLFELANKIQYDFTFGLDSLESVTVLWDGSKAILQFDYSFNAQILPNGETYMVDPTFLETPDNEETIYEFDGNDICEDVGSPTYGVGSTQTLSTVVHDVDTPVLDCSRAWWEYDTTSIPAVATFINASTFLEEFANLSNNENQTTHTLITSFQPSTRTDAQQFDEIDNDIVLATITPRPLLNNTIQYDAAAILALQNNYEAGWLGFGMKQVNETLIAGSGGDRQWKFCGSNNPISCDFGPKLTIQYYVGGQPDAVDDLIITNIRFNTLDLTWTQPVINGTLDGYQINFTTPHGDPDDIITNNTQTNVTSFAVSGLTHNTPYSFRIGVWMDLDNPFSNMSGNIANATTFNFGNFTVGAIDINATNIDFRTWIFARTDLNSSAYSLSVIYPSTFNASCTFHFKFANSDQSHSNLATTIPATGQLEATFLFNNTANEIIDVLCIDETDSTNAEGRYLLTQAIPNFLLLQQFEDFRSGVYGTEGMFGSLDMITLVGILVAMIGLNRINESVGMFFLLVILGVMAFFQIIVWPTALTGAIAVITMLVITSTRKN